MYANVESKLSVDHHLKHVGNLDDYLSGVGATIHQHTSSIVVEVTFSNLAYTNLDNNNFSWRIELKTNLAGYTVNCGGGIGGFKVGDRLSRTYEHQLATDEVEAMTREQVAQHIQWIEKISGANVSTP